MLRVGDELLVDDPAKEVVMTQITSLETDRRVEQRSCRSGQRRSGPGPRTRCRSRYPSTETARPTRFKISVPGDELFAVGEARKVEGFKFEIVKIKLRGEGFADAAPRPRTSRECGVESFE